MRAPFLLLLGLGLGQACARSSVPVPAGSAASPGPTASVAVVAAPSATPAREHADSGVPCGALGCLQFRSPEAAFEYVLASKPRVLAVGEAHAQRGSESVASTTARFTEQFLPRLVGRARALVVEILVANGKCGQVEQQVAERQQPVTEPQAASNQNEFLLLAQRAKALGILPHPLRPNCDEYRAVAGAGQSDIERLLITVRDTSLRTLSALLESAPKGGDPEMIVAYGGALHNDLVPHPGREAWSFGPALQERTQGRYVELDLIVPEYIRDTESWRAFSWYSEYQAARPAQQTLLYSPSHASFVLVFPRSAP